MHLKKPATVLISTVTILALMSILGCLMYKMIKSNNELGSFYEFDKDIYDLNTKEEEILYKYMKELNKERKEVQSNLGEDNKDEIGLFAKDFEREIDNSKLKYIKDANKLFLTTNNENGRVRKREILCRAKDEKIILIPTFKFENNYE